MSGIKETDRRKGYRIICSAILLAVLMPLLFPGCGDSPTGSVLPIAESRSYVLDGTVIETRYSGWPIPPGESPERDTIRISYTVTVATEVEMPGFIRFYGLEGADAGRSENRFYPDCTVPDDCKVYGDLIGIDEFSIDLENGDRTFSASGYVTTGRVIFRAGYNHQNISIDYDFKGDRLSH